MQGHPFPVPIPRVPILRRPPRPPDQSVSSFNSEHDSALGVRAQLSDPAPEGKRLSGQQAPPP